ncbi:putative exported hydrolase [Bacillus sp. LM 4-2]|nr:putative exported hydrolase [Bacillus sp. LM 4-2]MBT1089089.1 hypothetical protein [Bacillus subtilis]QHH18658.1 hypothetical protein GTW28_01380 [Bacillus subtilis]WFP01647.1 hypothetical protein JEQ25_01370 [Bacillus subtilis]
MAVKGNSFYIYLVMTREPNWGFTEEQMILKEQYDGVIWLEHITPSVIIK